MLGIPLNLLFFVPAGLFGILVRYLFAPLLSLGYLGPVAAIIERGRSPWLAARLAEIGRAALSCYVLQNVLAAIIFYGWGFGLTGRIGAPGTIAAAIAISSARALFAHLWLRRFSSGPLETIWRWLAGLPFRAIRAEV